MDQDSKRFILAKEFIRERNWVEGYSHDEWSFQCEYDSAISQLLCLFASSHPGSLVLLTLRLWKPASISSTNQRKVL